ncbi:hypothetical protein KEM55_004026 [Ascosphaera atra]|nr:hypothetical protein KEM55_004026 [Ascosphaera atra]
MSSSAPLLRNFFSKLKLPSSSPGARANLPTRRYASTTFTSTSPISRLHSRLQSRPQTWQQAWQSRILRTRHLFTRRAFSSPASPTSTSKPSLSQRLKIMSREYGWAAVGVYLALSALDFPFCYLLVRSFGVERIGHVEKTVVNAFKGIVDKVWPRTEEDKKKEEEESELQSTAASLGMAEGEKASLWTQLVLAYAIHKSLLIFIRVPLTAAITPKVVKTLRGWGWNIGKRQPQAAAEATAKAQAKKATKN